MGETAGAAAANSAQARLLFHLPPDPSHLRRARERIRDYLQQYCSEKRVIDELVLCIEEAATNTIRHSGSDQYIEMSIGFEAGDLVAEVRDHGIGFDVAAFDRDALPDVLSDHGRGLFLISRLCDDMQLRCDGGLEVRIVKTGVARGEAPALESGLGGVDALQQSTHREARLRIMLEEIGEAFVAPRLGVSLRARQCGGAEHDRHFAR
jgi:anti-sigma regulatory factor (Ser/Thr protein kinase)